MPSPKAAGGGMSRVRGWGKDRRQARAAMRAGGGALDITTPVAYPCNEQAHTPAQSARQQSPPRCQRRRHSYLETNPPLRSSTYQPLKRPQTISLTVSPSPTVSGALPSTSGPAARRLPPAPRIHPRSLHRPGTFSSGKSEAGCQVGYGRNQAPGGRGGPVPGAGGFPPDP